jgi:hypothetical protein
MAWVYSYAYENDPNTSIAAGEVPEPSIWVLLALSGIAIFASHQRSSANFKTQRA